MSITKEQFHQWITKRYARLKELSDAYAALKDKPDEELAEQLDLMADAIFELLDLEIATYAAVLGTLSNIQDLADLPGIRFGAMPPPPKPDPLAYANIRNIERKIDQVIRLLGSTPYSPDQ